MLRSLVGSEMCIRDRGSEDVPTTDIIVQMQCGTTPNVQLGAVGVSIEEMDTIADGITDVGTMTADTGYAMQIAGAAACNTEESIPVFIHIKGAGSTYEVLQIDDRTDGAPII